VGAKVCSFSFLFRLNIGICTKREKNKLKHLSWGSWGIMHHATEGLASMQRKIGCFIATNIFLFQFPEFSTQYEMLAHHDISVRGPADFIDVENKFQSAPPSPSEAVSSSSSPCRPVEASCRVITGKIGDWFAFSGYGGGDSGAGSDVTQSTRTAFEKLKGERNKICAIDLFN
jgi:hypothetical protein